MSRIEQRRFTRVPFETEVRIKCIQGTQTSNLLHDLSLGGASVDLEDEIAPGTMCTLEMDLIGPATLLRISLEGEVVRSDGERTAFKFTKIDLDSLVHLRHFIKVRTQDPELIESEYRQNMLQMDTR